jgi:ketosteroid isomerase-like protein
MPEASTARGKELLQRQIDAVHRRDFDTAVAVYAPDAVWDTSALGVGVFEGHNATRGFYEDWIAAYADFRAELEEFRDLGNTVSFAVIVHQARLDGSSGIVEFRYAVVRAWADDLVQRDIVYTDIDKGRADAERLAEERG